MKNLKIKGININLGPIIGCTGALILSILACGFFAKLLWGSLGHTIQQIVLGAFAFLAGTWVLSVIVMIVVIALAVVALYFGYKWLVKWANTPK